MVNIARQMSMTKDPDEFNGSGGPNRKSKAARTEDRALKGFDVFQAEMRRGLWWDIFYYDL